MVLARLKPELQGRPDIWDQPPALLHVTIINDEACPRCGAYWGNPNCDSQGRPLDFPNRLKVDNDFRCYNPNCTCAYYRDGQVLEDELPPDELAAMHERVRNEVAAMMAGKVWITKGNTSQLHPESDPIPAGWHLTGTHKGD